MIDLVEEVGSTNDAMLDRAQAGAAEGQWLVARRQTGGRGRSGRIWTAPPGNLSASGLVRLRPSDPPAPTLALVAGLAAWDVAATYLLPPVRPMLKWPNDVLVAGAKLAGILLERRGDAVVVGIGLNIASAPTDLDRAVTSFAALGGAAPPIEDAAAVLAESFARWLAAWRGQGVPTIRSAWMERAHPPGTALSVRNGAEVLEGLFEGLDEAGTLRLRRAEGIVSVAAGDVVLL